MLADFSATTRTTVAVPNLMEVGLSFKRIQRLGYEDRPLLQMIFLPPQGKPTALCVLPAELKDAAIKQSTRNGMQVVSWRRRGMAYVLVTDLSEKNATSVALKLMSDAYPAVYRS